MLRLHYGKYKPYNKSLPFLLWFQRLTQRPVQADHRLRCLLCRCVSEWIPRHSGPLSHVLALHLLMAGAPTASPSAFGMLPSFFALCAWHVSCCPLLLGSCWYDPVFSHTPILKDPHPQWPSVLPVLHSILSECLLFLVLSTIFATCPSPWCSSPSSVFPSPVPYLR